VDGVLRNTFMGMAKAYLFMGGHKMFKFSDFKDYEFTKMMNIHNKEQFFRDYAETIFLDSRPMPYINEMGNLKQYGKIQIISSQFKGLENLTLEWLDKYKVPYDEVHFTWDKSNVKTDVLLDDYPENLKKMPKETLKVCYDALYNQDWTGTRVKNLREFVNLIENVRLVW
jgi:5'(3')-deoxyribonucleotidase